MKVECPSCHFSADMAAEKVPAKGTNATCPRCSTVFFVPPAETAADASSVSMTCPKCGFVQDVAERCARCGIIFEKYRAMEARRRMAANDGDARAAADDAKVREPDKTSFRFGYGRGEIMAWAGEGHIAEDALPRALRIAGALPGPNEWRRFLDALALWMGALFLALAVIFFFAYNWKKLGHFARFGIVELLLAGAVVASWRLGIGRMSGKAALLVATLLVGALLAVVGQTYQTGADPWELFATWTIFILPWVAISRFPPLWLLWLTLVNLSASLYYHTFGGILGLVFGTETLWWTLAAVNTAALAVWEAAAHGGVTWLAERWAIRIVATASAGYATILAGWAIVDRDMAGIAELLGYSAWLACAYAVYRRRIRDLYVLALGVLSVIIVIALFLGHNLGDGDAGALLLVGMAVLGLSAAGGWWLRTVAREVEA